MIHRSTRSNFSVFILPTFHTLSLVLLLASLAVGTAPAAEAANFDVRVINNSFVPRDITIQEGDTVTWTNEGVLHNVRADDNSFRCANGCDSQGGNGAPASNSWTVTLTFDQAGDVPYHCEFHGFSGGIGMAGTVTVEGAPVVNNGNLTLAAANIPVSESVGTVQVRVDRNSGSDGQVSVQIATFDGTATAPGDYTSASTTLTWPDGDANPRFFPVTVIDDSEDEAQERFNVLLSNPAGGASLGRSSSTVTINDNDDSGPNQGAPGNLAFAQELYEVSEADGTATVHVERTGGSSGQVSVQVTASGGTATEDADYTPVTETVVFGAGDTSIQQVVIPILQDTEDEGAETINLRLSAFQGGASQGPIVQSQVAILDDEGLDSCSEADGLTLCLGVGGRFKVQVSFRNRVPPAQGGGTTTDRGDKLSLNRDSGLFTFFDPNNAELLVKILAGCPITNHYWVFLAGTTNVEYTLTVTDTENPGVFYTSNPLDRTAVAVLDTRALETCP